MRTKLSDILNNKAKFLKTLGLCLVPKKYQEKKNVKENDFLISDFTIIFLKEN